MRNITESPLELVSREAAASQGEAASVVADYVRSAIFDGRFAPGQHIRQELIARETGISRVPVREALRILASEGMVTLVANKGARVAKLSLAECRELYEIRENIEPMLIGMNTPYITPEVTEQLYAMVAAMETASPEEFSRIDREFHDLTYSAHSGLVLGQMVHNLWDRTYYYRRAYILATFGQTGIQVSNVDHKLIAEAMARGDGEEAGAIMRYHVRRTRMHLHLLEDLDDPTE